MTEPHDLVPLDVDAIVEHARASWRDATLRAPHTRVEFYAKVAERARVQRGHAHRSADYGRSIESGIAIRVFTSHLEGAGFAAASGFSRDAARWVLDRAVARGSVVSGVSPDTEGIERGDTWDLDPVQFVPPRSELLTEMGESPSVDWIEGGTTAEVLVGTTGWLAVRRRHRVWGLVGTGTARIIAGRSLAGWREARSRSEVESANALAGRLPASQTVTLLPEASAPIVQAAVGWAHLGEPSKDIAGGSGWSVEDDPLHPEGLSGGVLDDAGFTAAPRVLAREGDLVGRLSGPGTLRRRSFREPPRAAPSNITMPAGLELENRPLGEVADKCRLIPLSPELWVLDLEILSGNGMPRRRAYVRVRPAELLGGCARRIGEPQITGSGPIVPSLVFDRLRLDFPT